MSRRNVVRCLCFLLVLAFTVGCASGKQEDNQQSQTTTAGENTSKSPTETGKQEKRVITLIRPGDPEKVKSFLEPAKEEFNKNNPDLDLQVQYEGWGGWIEKYPTLLNSNTQPDIMFWQDNKLNDTAIKDKLVPLDSCMDSKVIELLPKSVLDFVKMNDKLLYLPVSVDPFVLYYRKDVYEKAELDPNDPPATWQELLDAAKAIHEKTGVAAIGVPGKGGMETLQEFISLFVYQATGNDWLDENNKPIFNTPDGVKALEFVQELLKYAQEGPAEYDRGGLRPGFRDGTIAMIIDSAWPIPDFQAKFGKNLDESPIGIAPPPEGPKGKVNWAGTDGWIITRAEKAADCGRVLNFLANSEQTFKHHVGYGGAPTMEYELTQPEFQYEFWKSFQKAMSEYKLIPMVGRYHPTPSAFYPEYEEVWQQLILGRIGPKEALDLAEQKTHELNQRQGIK
jgi:multiple sugar transport system substrate-binding protein